MVMLKTVVLSEHTRETEQEGCHSGEDAIVPAGIQEMLTV